VIRWTEEASADFLGLHEHIAQDNPAAADRQCERIMSAVAQLQNFPHSGKRTRQRNIFALPVPRTPYVIQYRIDENAIILLSVLHGAMRRRRIPSA
jgi:plasmid stabilization system protein ParE